MFISLVVNRVIHIIPIPTRGIILTLNEMNALKNCPPRACFSLLADMKRCAVIPSPAVGDPAKKRPSITNISNVSGGVTWETGLRDNVSGLIPAAFASIASHPPN